MTEFRVGDWVRVLDDDNGECPFKFGNIYKVEHVFTEFHGEVFLTIDLGDGSMAHGFYAGRFAPVKGDGATDAGAQEYEEIMRIQDLMGGDDGSQGIIHYDCT